MHYPYTLPFHCFTQTNSKFSKKTSQVIKNNAGDSRGAPFLKIAVFHERGAIIFPFSDI